VWHPWEERLEPPAVTDDLGTTYAQWADAEAGDFRVGYGLSREAALSAVMARALVAGGR
jgi:hypothetical protein